MVEIEIPPIYPAELVEPKKTPEMIKRVAKAICDAGIAWLQENDAKRQNLEWADVPDEAFARAAIEAMREPTEAMTEAGERSGCGVSDFRTASEVTWQAMVNEALK